MTLAQFIEKFIEKLPAERRLFPDLYASDLAEAIYEFMEEQ